ncbi:MAG: DUF2244 domain-containing protein [Acetobacteraceae bacterium]|nr:DUF2244 domain-containing protein [Acetobacteraceae bacterium]
MAGPALVRRRASLGRLGTNSEVAGLKFATVGVTSAVLLTFAVVESANLAPDGWPAAAVGVTFVDQVLFKALIVPHRSLSPRGLRIVAGLMLGGAALIALRVWLIGAWPVLAFSVVEAGLAVGLLALNARQSRASELVLLTERAVSVTRVDPKGRRVEVSIPAAWLSVVLEEAPGQVPRLVLAAHGTREEVAASLGEAEKRDLAAALRDALWGLRNPVFDNPQLRDGAG